MSHLAFILDGNTPDFRPALPLFFASCLMPAVTILGCWLVARSKRWYSCALGLASTSAFLLVAPLYKVALNNYEPYDTGELACFWSLVALPFLGIVLTHQLRKKSASSPASVAGAAPQPTPEVFTPPRRRAFLPRYQTDDETAGENSWLGKSLLFGATIAVWLLFAAALALQLASDVVPDWAIRGEGDGLGEAANGCFVLSLLIAALAAAAWIFGVQLRFKKRHRWARWGARATYAAIPIALGYAYYLAPWVDQHALIAIPMVEAIGAIGMALAAVLLRRRLVDTKTPR